MTSSIMPFRPLPDEWLSAHDAWKELNQVARLTQQSQARHLFGLVVPFLVFFAGGAWVADLVKPGLIQGVLAVVGVLSGFAIAVLLFVGSIGGAERLELELARAYVAKVKYLCWSLANTLGVYVFTAASSVVWLAANEITPRPVWMVAVSGVVLGLFGLSLLRTALLPYQIYEVHRFNLDELLDRKEKETRAAMAARREALEKED